MTSRKVLSLLALFAVLTLVAASCGSSGGDGADSGPEPNAGAEGQRDHVKFLLAFVHDMVAVQYYFAEDFGYFDQCGIDIEYQTAAEVENPAQLIVGGAVDIGILDPLTYISGVHRGLPLVAIAEDTARTGVAYVSLAETGIEGPGDLPGHTVGVNPGGDNLWFLEKIMEDNLTPEEQTQVEIVPAGFSIQPLMTGNIDVYTAWTTDSGLNTLKHEGNQFNEIRANENGIVTMGNVIVVSEETLQEKTDLVTRFLAAVAGGFHEVTPDHEEQAIDSALERIGEDIPREVEGSIYQQLQDLFQDPVWEEMGAGWHNPDAYAQTQDFLLEHGEISEAMPVEELFTTDLLEQVYADGVPQVDEVCGT
jgi:ABC-type nitrate/sulfonate/bicarbonate transport system substrate-binding protein